MNFDNIENNCYGLTRLSFINSAKYDIAVFPIDRPLSIFGENNVGKSTAVNALQFLLISDQRKMNFGKHSLEESREFYFPDICSYILIEIILKHGHYVIGAAGLGKLKQHQYKLFYYKGSFDSDDYFNKDRECLNIKDLSQKLISKNVHLHQTTAEELKKILMGNSTSSKEDITIMPFKNATQNNYHCFIEIFQNLIHMKKVRSTDMKDLLINVCDSKLVNGDINFREEYEAAYKEVKNDERQLKLLENIAEKSKDLFSLHKSFSETIKMINEKYPVLIASIKEWFTVYEDYCIAVSKKIDKLDEAIKDFPSQNEKLNNQISTKKIAIEKVEIWLKRVGELEEKFLLNQDVEKVKNNKSKLFEEVSNLHELLKKAKDKDIKKIESNILRLEKDKANLELKLKFFDNNVYGILDNYFSKDELGNVFKLLNSNILSLPENAVNDKNILKAYISSILKDIRDGIFTGHGFHINLKDLPDHDSYNKKEIEEQIQVLSTSLENVNKEYDVAKEYEKKKIEFDKLTIDFETCSKDLEDLCEYNEKLKERINKRTQREQLVDNLQELKKLSKNLSVKLEENTGKKSNIAKKQDEKERTKELLLKFQSKISSDLDDLPETNKVDSNEVIRPDEDLINYANNFIELAEEQKKLNDKIQDKLELLEQNEAGKYFGADNTETINNLKAAIDSIPEKKELFQKSQDAALISLGSSLKELRKNYDRLEKEIKVLNRAMNKNSISDLSKVEIEIRPTDRLLEAIDTLLDSSSALFGNNSSSELAIYELNEFVAARGNRLSLVDLFELSFAAFGATGNKTTYRDLDSIESNGTTITIKAVVNMNLLYKLLDRKNEKINFPYYLDEAADLDPKNQKTLIEQGMNMGFIPILASVKPQQTAYYCVGLETEIKRHYIDEDNWVILEPKHNE